jgi:hypothetical protein
MRKICAAATANCIDLARVAAMSDRAIAFWRVLGPVLVMDALAPSASAQSDILNLGLVGAANFPQRR